MRLLNISYYSVRVTTHRVVLRSQLIGLNITTFDLLILLAQQTSNHHDKQLLSVSPAPS